MLTNLAECKKHKGPLTAFDIKRIDDLNDDQVLLEAGYLKKTIAPNIRIKRKEGKKMINFTIDELKLQIRDVILPSSKANTDVHSL